MAEPNLIVAQIKRDIQDQLKAEWRVGDVGWRPYVISRTDLEAWSNDARRELSALVTVVRQDGRDRCGHQLKRLAVCGKELYETLFGRGYPDELARVSRNWLENDVKHPVPLAGKSRPC